MPIASDHRANNFDLIRLLAALQVVFIHGSIHLKLNESFSGFQKASDILAHVPGVPVFFVISGYLICMSYLNSKDTLAYTINRFLRIYPALYVCLGVSIAVLAIFGFVTAGSFVSKGFAAWVSAQLTIFQFYNPDAFRGFGVGVVNGSLWTIPVELMFYMALPLIFLLAGRNKGTSSNLVLGLLFAASFVLYCWVREQNETMAIKLLGVSVFPYLWMFLLGVFAQLHWKQVESWIKGRFIWWLSAFVVTSLVFNAGTGSLSECMGLLVSRILLAGLALSGAYSMRWLSNKILRENDLSYGTYIYHMLLVNVLVELNFTGRPWHLAATYAGTLTLAFLSWRFIESPALKAKKGVRAWFLRFERVAPETVPAYSSNETSLTKP